MISTNQIPEIILGVSDLLPPSNTRLPVGPEFSWEGAREVGVRVVGVRVGLLVGDFVIVGLVVGCPVGARDGWLDGVEVGKRHSGYRLKHDSQQPKIVRINIFNILYIFCQR